MGRRVQELELEEDRHHFKDSVGQGLYLDIVYQILTDNDDIVVFMLIAFVNHLHGDANDRLCTGSQHQDYWFCQAFGVSEGVGFRSNVCVLAAISGFNDALHLDDTSYLVYVDPDL